MRSLRFDLDLDLAPPLALRFVLEDADDAADGVAERGLLVDAGPADATAADATGVTGAADATDATGVAAERLPLSVLAGAADASADAPNAANSCAFFSAD